ncbi:Cytosolic carboxypeptidase 1 [Nowakowskiella sp. JEL0407]|nr:Cytosolic carboxypeptidase 1 [Nowakowskiella sp. JEL0407]
MKKSKKKLISKSKSKPTYDPVAAEESTNENGSTQSLECIDLSEQNNGEKPHEILLGDYLIVESEVVENSDVKDENIIKPSSSVTRKKSRKKKHTASSSTSKSKSSPPVDKRVPRSSVGDQIERDDLTENVGDKTSSNGKDEVGKRPPTAPHTKNTRILIKQRSNGGLSRSRSAVNLPRISQTSPPEIKSKRLTVIVPSPNCILSPAVTTISFGVPLSSLEGIGSGSNGIGIQPQPAMRILERISQLMKYIKDFEEKHSTGTAKKDRGYFSENEAKDGNGEGSLDAEVAEVEKKIGKQISDLRRLIEKETPSLASGYFKLEITCVLSTNVENSLQILICVLHLIIPAAPINPNTPSWLLISLVSQFTTSQNGSATFIGAESFNNNITSLIKRKITLSVLTCMQNIHLENGKRGNLGLEINRYDEFIYLALLVLTKIGKIDVKVPLLFRIYGCMDYTVECICRWKEVWERSSNSSISKNAYMMMMSGFNALRLFSIKNDNNALLLCRIGVLELSALILQNRLNDIASFFIGYIVDILSILARNKQQVFEILKKFNGILFFLSLLTHESNAENEESLKLKNKDEFDKYDGFEEEDDAGGASIVSESLQKSTLKLLKMLLDTDEGRDSFKQCEGQKILTDMLGKYIQQNDFSVSTSPFSVPSLLLSTLRIAATPADLPSHERLYNRKFEIPQHTPITITLISMQKFCPELCSSEVDSFSWKEAVKEAQRESKPVFESVKHIQPFSEPVCSMIPRIPQTRACGVGPEVQYKRPGNLMKKILFEQTTQILKASSCPPLIVYDLLDANVAEYANKIDPKSLIFDSRFESGNLQIASKVSETDYDLILESDINTEMGRHNQWFFFSIQRMQANLPYRFSFINMSKTNSQFNSGMQPVMFSLSENCWRRVGENVCYFRNNYRKEDESLTDVSSLTYSTLQLNITFKKANDVCFLAYHYPYTFTDLQDFLNLSHLDPDFNNRCVRQELCRTLGGNRVDLLTITDFQDTSIEMNERRYIFLMSRVHPGESNSSFILEGGIKFLLSDDEVAKILRKKIIFKIIPMLNPDGVINGSHRCSLAGVDLNRQWQHPSPTQCPTIFYTKQLYLHILQQGKRPFLSCDFHGHSRRKNIFLFGVENGPGIHDGLEKVFPQLISDICPLFDYSKCRYNIEKSKETTARVIICKELCVLNSFTLESTYCGGDFGIKKGLQYQISDLEQVGIDFCKAIWEMVQVFDDAGVDSLSVTPAAQESTHSTPTSNGTLVSTPVIKKKKTIKNKSTANKKKNRSESSSDCIFPKWFLKMSTQPPPKLSFAQVARQPTQTNSQPQQTVPAPSQTTPAPAPVKPTPPPQQQQPEKKSEKKENINFNKRNSHSGGKYHGKHNQQQQSNPPPKSTEVKPVENKPVDKPAEKSEKSTVVEQSQPTTQSAPPSEPPKSTPSTGNKSWASLLAPPPAKPTSTATTKAPTPATQAKPAQQTPPSVQPAAEASEPVTLQKQLSPLISESTPPTVIPPTSAVTTTIAPPVSTEKENTPTNVGDVPKTGSRPKFGSIVSEETTTTSKEPSKDSQPAAVLSPKPGPQPINKNLQSIIPPRTMSAPPVLPKSDNPEKEKEKPPQFGTSGPDTSLPKKPEITAENVPQPAPMVFPPNPYAIPMMPPVSGPPMPGHGYPNQPYSKHSRPPTGQGRGNYRRDQQQQQQPPMYTAQYPYFNYYYPSYYDPSQGGYGQGGYYYPPNMYMQPHMPQQTPGVRPPMTTQPPVSGALPPSNVRYPPAQPAPAIPTNQQPPQQPQQPSQQTQLPVQNTTPKKILIRDPNTKEEVHLPTTPNKLPRRESNALEPAIQPTPASPSISSQRQPSPAPQKPVTPQIQHQQLQPTDNISTTAIPVAKPPPKVVLKTPQGTILNYTPESLKAEKEAELRSRSQSPAKKIEDQKDAVVSNAVGAKVVEKVAEVKVFEKVKVVEKKEVEVVTEVKETEKKVEVKETEKVEKMKVVKEADHSVKTEVKEVKKIEKVEKSQEVVTEKTAVSEASTKKESSTWSKVAAVKSEAPVAVSVSKKETKVEVKEEKVFIMESVEVSAPIKENGDLNHSVTVSSPAAEVLDERASEKDEDVVTESAETTVDEVSDKFEVEDQIKEEPVAEEAPKTPELEEGEIVDDTPAQPTTPSKPTIKTEISTPTKHYSETDSPSVKKQAAPTMAGAKPKITDFATVVYPDTLTVALPFKDDKGIIRYSNDFLMLFQTLSIPPPPGLPTIEQLTEDKPQSPRGGRSNSNRANSGGPVSMNRGGSTSESGGRHGSNPSAFTSNERYAIAMSKKSGLGMPQNTLIRGPQNQGTKVGRTGSNRAERGTNAQRQGSQGQQQQRQQSGLWQPAPAPEPVEKLEVSDNAWRPTVSKKLTKEEEVDEELAHRESIFKKTRALLNKLTLEKFDSISQKVLDIGISSEAILQGVINLIFDKALDEPTFGGMYAQLCQFLSQNLPRVQQWIDLDTRNNAFRRILLNKCQEEFESGQKWADQAETMAKQLKKADELPADERETLMERVFAINKAKRRALGNIHFIGELFKLQMLTEKIIHSCISQLLRNITEPEEEDIESLCKLMTTVGQKIDHSKAKSYMDTYFARLSELSKHMGLPSRIRFMLKDLIDLRKSNWTLRAIQAQSGPKTIAQIHEEAEKKKRAEEEENAKNQGRGGRGGRDRQDRERSGYGSGGGGNSGTFKRGGGSQMERNSSQREQQDGWTLSGSGGTKPQRQESLDISRFGEIKRTSASSFTLGPQTNYQMGSGARGWININKEKKESEKPKVQNTFALLEDHHEDHGSPADSKKDPTSNASTPAHSRPTSPVQSPDPINSPEPIVLEPTIKAKKIDESTAKKRATSTLEEYWSVKLKDEVVLSVKELGPEWGSLVVLTFLELTMETKLAKVEEMGHVLVELVNSGAVTKEDIKSGLSQYAELLEDLSIDVPEMFKFFSTLMAILMGPSIISFPDDALIILQPITSSKSLSPPISKILTELISAYIRINLQGSKEGVYEVFGGADYKVFFNDLKDRTKEQMVQMWLSRCPYAVDVAPVLWVSGEVALKLKKDNAESIVTWIEKNVPETIQNQPEYVKAVTTEVIKQVASQTFFPAGEKQAIEQSREMFTKMEESVKKYQAVLESLVRKGETDSDEEDKQVLVVCAIEEYVGSIGYPKDLLVHLLRIFAKNEIVTPSSQLRWKTEMEEKNDEIVMKEIKLLKQIDQSPAKHHTTNLISLLFLVLAFPTQIYALPPPPIPYPFFNFATWKPPTKEGTTVYYFENVYTGRVMGTTSIPPAATGFLVNINLCHSLKHIPILIFILQHRFRTNTIKVVNTAKDLKCPRQLWRYDPTTFQLSNIYQPNLCLSISKISLQPTDKPLDPITANDPLFNIRQTTNYPFLNLTLDNLKQPITDTSATIGIGVEFCRLGEIRQQWDISDSIAKGDVGGLIVNRGNGVCLMNLDNWYPAKRYRVVPGNAGGNGQGFGYDRKQMLPRSSDLDFAGIVAGTPICGAGVISAKYAVVDGTKGLPGLDGRRKVFDSEPNGEGVEYWKAVVVGEDQVPGYFPGMISCMKMEMQALRNNSWD